jgi:hypothetical protein
VATAPSTHTVNSVTCNGTLNITGGTLIVNGRSDIVDLTMSGGTLTGAGTITVSGAYLWTGGTMEGDGVTRVEGTLEIDGSVNRVLRGTRTLQNVVSATWQGTGSVFLNQESLLHNLGTFDIQNVRS